MNDGQQPSLSPFLVFVVRSRRQWMWSSAEDFLGDFKGKQLPNFLVENTRHFWTGYPIQLVVVSLFLVMLINT
jgi:hypothetical protein